MARQGEATNGSVGEEDLTVPSLADYALEESRRHRAVTELKLPNAPDATRPASTIPPGSKDATGMLTDELREGLWAAISTFVFVPPAADAWAGSPGARPTVHRVWTSPPIGAGAPLDGDGEVPEDVADLIEEWFSLAKDGDVYALVETVLASLPDAHQVHFASACNLVLERGLSDHRFVGRRLMPIASKSDVATIERALVSARAKHLSDAEAQILAALDHLAAKPEPDAPAAVHAAIRAVQATAFALTKERPLDLADTLDILEEKGFIDAAIKARHGGLFAWVGTNGRKPRTEDARLILVTCAGFVTYLAGLV
ncbi:MAG: hypothetical protein U0270_39410 [Labilithrix sp.]